MTEWPLYLTRRSGNAVKYAKFVATIVSLQRVEMEVRMLNVTCTAPRDER